MAEPDKVIALFDYAVTFAERARALASPDAELSHVGFRTLTRKEWMDLRRLAEPYGETFVTRKGEREIVFIKLTRPLTLEGTTIDYLEFPQPKDIPTIGQAPVVVAFAHPTVAIGPTTGNGFEIRQSPHHARDFIARDAGPNR